MFKIIERQNKRCSLYVYNFGRHWTSWWQSLWWLFNLRVLTVFIKHVAMFTRLQAIKGWAVDRLIVWQAMFLTTVTNMVTVGIAMTTTIKEGQAFVRIWVKIPSPQTGKAGTWFWKLRAGKISSVGMSWNENSLQINRACHFANDLFNYEQTMGHIFWVYASTCHLLITEVLHMDHLPHFSSFNFVVEHTAVKPKKGSRYRWPKYIFLLSQEHLHLREHFLSHSWRLL